MQSDVRVDEGALDEKLVSLGHAQTKVVGRVYGIDHNKGSEGANGRDARRGRG